MSRLFFWPDLQVSMLSEDESDAEVMQRLAPLSRSIQDFIAQQLRLKDTENIDDSTSNKYLL